MKVKYFEIKKKDLRTSLEGAIGACRFSIAGKEDVISFDAFEFSDGSLRLFLPDEVKKNLIEIN